MRRFLAVVFGLALTLLSTASVRSDDAASLLAKNKAFAGWAFGDPSMAGLLLTGNVGDRQIVDLRRGALWRQTIVDPKTRVTSDIGFTGKLFWYADFNGFTVPLRSDAIKYYVAYQTVMNQGIPALAGELRGSAAVNGTPAQIVRVQPPQGATLDAYIEPSSGRLLRAVIDPSGSPTAIDILQYADLEGKKIISSWHVGSEVFTTTVERTRIVDADFHPPAQKARWTFGPLEPIPVTFTGNRMSMRAAVNGVAGDFMLDTAAISIFLNPAFAKRAHVKDTKGIAKIDTLAIGANVLHDVLVRTRLDAPGPLQDFDGLLGFDFLAGAIVDVDTTKRALTIYDPAQYAVTAPGPPIVVNLTSGQPSVPVTLNGRVKGHFLFDTGEPTAVVASNGLYGPPRGIEMRTESTSRWNSAPVNCGRLQNIEIGGAVKYDNVPACFGDYSKVFGADGGVIGLDFLERFDLTFDYPESTLYLTPLKK